VPKDSKKEDEDKIQDEVQVVDFYVRLKTKQPSIIKTSKRKVLETNQ
jgi:hypothetical protein